MIVETSVEIDVPVATAWRVLTDFPNYARWNPFVIRMEGAREPKVGDVVKLHARLQKGVVSLSSNRITRWVPPNPAGPAELQYELTGAMGSLVACRRTQTLTRIGDYRCEYRSFETFEGWGRYLVPHRRIVDGTFRMGEALKWAAEGELVQTSLGSVYPASPSVSVSRLPRILPPPVFSDVEDP
jgi:hypothetical protein